MLALTAIIKDDSELQVTSRMLQSFSPFVDGIFIALTGTSGKFSKLIKLFDTYDTVQYTITTPETHPSIYLQNKEGKYFFANFAEARNVTYNMIPKKYKYVIWADADDVIVAGEELKEAVKYCDKHKLDALYFNYWYSVNTNSKGEISAVNVEHYRERLMRTGVFKWVSRLHEVVVPIDPNYRTKTSVWNEGEDKQCVWCHLTTQDRVNNALERNEAILTVQAQEENYEDPRTLFYLAKILFEKKDPESLDKAIPLLEKYLEKSGWDAERANALEYLGLIYTLKKDYRKALRCYHEAVKEYPKNHLAYLRLASTYYDIGQDEFADHWLDMAMKFDLPKATATVQNTEEIKLLGLTLKYIQARRRNDIEGMLEWANKRAGLMGKDDGLLAEVKQIEELNMAAQGLYNLCIWLNKNKYQYKIIDFVSLLPKEIGQLPAISNLATTAGLKKTWGDKSIVYYASWGSSHVEQWGPNSADKGGIGGSETAVIRLSEHWASLGYEVTVFADIEKEVIKNGVHWLPYYAINWNDNFNILILWRAPHLINRVKKAKKLFMDLHDIASQLDWDDKRMKKIDKVFFKSDWHRTNLPKLPDSKAVVISNGIKI